VIAFLDASAVIYAVEGSPEWSEALKQQLRQLAMADQASAGGLQLAISRLSWLECRVGPLRRRDAEALARFDAFFLHPDLEWVELSPAVVERATLLRAELNLRTPDALQAASCLQLGADAVMVTGDAGFQRVPTLRLALVNGVDHRD
jgi:predicted nucleic acid-binding protein